jgi:2-aminoadipate transaminase
MIDYDGFLSRAASGMKESAIRRMGGLAARNRDVISFAPGHPSAETFLCQDFQEIARELLSGSDEDVLQYGPTRGFRPLLDLVAGIMDLRGAPTAAERLLITTGSQQGLDLVARVLLDPDDVVLVELPTYTGAIAAFRNVQAHMAGVRQEADGIDLAALDAVHARLVRAGRRVRLLYLVPNFQNPTGLLIGRQKRLALLEWAARHDILILEDDPYREIYFDAATEADVRPMRSDDREDRVVYLSSFSKTLAPGYRVAWIDAPAPLATKFELAKQAADLCTGTLDQRLVYEVARRGVLDRQLPLLRTHYREKRDVMVASLGRELADVVSWVHPRGGFFLWARLPEHLDANRLLDRAVRHGVVYVAGEAFFVDDAEGGGADLSKDHGGLNLLRLSFSGPTHSRIREGVVRLAAAIREELAELSSSASVAQQAR